MRRHRGAEAQTAAAVSSLADRPAGKLSCLLINDESKRKIRSHSLARRVRSYYDSAMTQSLLVILLLVSTSAFAQQPQKSEQKPAGTEISADLGPCSADFKVTDLAGKPLYNAKIQTQVRYGFLGTRKLDLELGTDANGRARFVKLPGQVKKGPMTFTVTHADLSAELSYDPVTNCHAEYVVPLGKK